MIKVFFTGRLGRDAEVRQAGSNTVCNFSVATDTGFGENKETLWMDCAIWGKRAEGKLPEYLTKGKMVTISGDLSQDSYQTNDGETRTALRVRVNDLDFGSNAEHSDYEPAPASTPEKKPDFEDDMPF